MKKMENSKQRVKVCMFVWNYFTNDARVTREAKSLIKAGYQVWVIAVHNRKDPNLAKEEINKGINIIRVTRFGFLYNIKSYIQLLKSKLSHKLSAKKQYSSKSTFLFTLSNHLVLAFYHLYMSLCHVVFYFVGLMTYIVNKLTFGFHKLFSSFIITTIKFIKYGLKVKADIYHSHDLNTLLAGYICSRINKAKLIYDSHEIATDKAGIKAKPFWHLLERMLIGKADEVIFTTYTRAKFTADKYDIELPEVIGNFTDIPKKIKKINLRKMLNLDFNSKIVLYQGGLQLGRGLEQLIEAVPLLRPDVIIVLLGWGKLMPLLEDRVNTLNLSERVKFAGKASLEDLLGYTTCADVGLQILQNICFNHYSTGSNKLFEYLSVGIPVVASDFPEIRKVVQEFDVGILIDPHKPENIAQAINYVLEDKNRYERMKTNAVKASKVFNWENESRKLLEIYKKLEDEFYSTSN